MTDPTQRDEADDARDSHVAALLDVAPLDDVTRRRLVANALRASSPRRVSGYRYLAATAVVVAGLVVAGGVLAKSGNSPRPTAAPQSSSSETDSQSGAGVDAPKSAERLTELTIAYLGEYGDLGDANQVARLQDEVVRSRSGAPVSSQKDIPADLADLAELVAYVLACEVVETPVLAVASGTLEARPAVVIITATDVVVLLRDSCETRPLG